MREPGKCPAPGLIVFNLSIGDIRIQPEVRKYPTPGTGNIRKCPGVAPGGVGGDGHCWN